MATELAQGGQATLDAFARMRDSSLPFEERYTADFTDHDPAEGQPAGPEGPAWFWEQFEKSFSEIERQVIETIATPTRLVTVMNLSGTHTGPVPRSPSDRPTLHGSERAGCGLSGRQSLGSLGLDGRDGDTPATRPDVRVCPWPVPRTTVIPRTATS